MISTFVLLIALGSPHQCTVWTAGWCPACKSMAADIDALHAEGWPIYHNDVDCQTDAEAYPTRAEAVECGLPYIIARGAGKTIKQAGQVSRAALRGILIAAGLKKGPERKAETEKRRAAREKARAEKKPPKKPTSSVRTGVAPAYWRPAKSCS